MSFFNIKQKAPQQEFYITNGGEKLDENFKKISAEKSNSPILHAETKPLLSRTASRIVKGVVTFGTSEIARQYKNQQKFKACLSELKHKNFDPKVIKQIISEQPNLSVKAILNKEYEIRIEKGKDNQFTVYNECMSRMRRGEHKNIDGGTIIELIDQNPYFSANQIFQEIERMRHL